jgi:hypothetical protein
MFQQPRACTERSEGIIAGLTRNPSQNKEMLKQVQHDNVTNNPINN